MKTNDVKVEMWPIERVKPYERNPRRNDAAVPAVAESIKRFGWRVPIIVDKDGVIIAGHTRFKAAKRLGLSEVPVHVASDLTPEQVRAYRLADNKTNEISEWKLDVLNVEIRDLIVDVPDIDLESLGFAVEEIKYALEPIPQFEPEAAPSARLDKLVPVKCPKCGYEFRPKNK